MNRYDPDGEMTQTGFWFLFWFLSWIQKNIYFPKIFPFDRYKARVRDGMVRLGWLVRMDRDCYDEFYNPNYETKKVKMILVTFFGIVEWHWGLKMGFENKLLWYLAFFLNEPDYNSWHYWFG